MITRFKLGIMALYLKAGKIEEKRLFRRFITAAEQMRIDAFVFTPEDVQGEKRLIKAHIFDHRRALWTRQWMPFPDIIFDRCRYQSSARFRQLRDFRAKYHHILYMNRPLANKWAIHQLLSKDDEIATHLPETEMYRTTAGLSHFAKKHRHVFVKPINGTGGRGVIRIGSLGQGIYTLAGRNRGRVIITPRKLNLLAIGRWLQSNGLSERCIMQQGIESTLPTGRVHDYRLLMQKNSDGAWAMTGCAGRVGAQRSVTSNLHGGGKAVAMKTLLRSTFQHESKVNSIAQEMETLGRKVVSRLESQYKDMCELALDIAVDRQGKVWLLETNPKPAREVFRRIGELETYRQTIIRPLEYARWLFTNAKK
jgi:glutathione synthase/RimK-type ligase-like ATP-grasp enzyme